MTQKKRRGGRKVRLAVAGAVAAMATTAFGAGSAQAATQSFQATFDDAGLNVGAAFDILAPPKTSTWGIANPATIDDTGTTRNFTVPANAFVFPEFSGEAVPGVTVTVNFNATGPITGTLNTATGDMTTTASGYHAQVSIGGTDCDYNTNLAFTTNDTGGAPFPGQPFGTVTLGPPTTPTVGDIQTSWGAGVWPANPDSNCSLVNGLISAQSGGLAMANGLPSPLVPPPPPEPPASTPGASPAPKKKCKKAKKKAASAKKKGCKTKKKKK